MHKIIFILGVGRSGTSLMQSILGTHSEIVFLPETAFIRRFIAASKFKRTLLKNGIPRFQDLLKEDHMLNRLDPDLLYQVVSRFQHCSADSCFKLKIYNDLISHYLYLSRKLHIGDKDPRLVEYLPLIRQLWPSALVVHMLRDPRDVLASKKKADWSKNRHWLLHVFANRVQSYMGRTQGRMLFGKKYFEVIYEKVLADPAKELRKLCEVLGVQFEPAMLSYEQTSRKLVANDEMDWKKETLGPILKNNSGKWKEQLNPMEVALTELVCGHAFAAGGYERSHAIHKLSFGRRLIVYFFAGLIITADPIYRTYRRLFIWWNQR